MWARTVEVMLGFWLAASPFIFDHSDDNVLLWWNDFLCAFLIIAFSLLSFWHRTSRMHLANIAIALWLMGFGYLGFSYPVPPAGQNTIMLGLILLMLAIIPSKATFPPKKWREYHSMKS
jgi:hypothetical protein